MIPSNRSDSDADTHSHFPPHAHKGYGQNAPERRGMEEGGRKKGGGEKLASCSQKGFSVSGEEFGGNTCLPKTWRLDSTWSRFRDRIGLSVAVAVAVAVSVSVAVAVDIVLPCHLL